MTGRLSIALLTHSTNPRGGVSHCLALAEALEALGHRAVVHAPDPAGRGFYRAARCGTVSVPAEPVADGTVGSMVLQRIAEYRRWFEDPRHHGFDVYHAHDGIGGNALADLTEAGLVPGFVRTVHHLDSFADERIATRQIRAVRAAAAVFCVSDHWVELLARHYGIAAQRVANGVDRAEFSSEPQGGEAALLARLGIGSGPLVLGVGGFEARKNTLASIEAFAALRRTVPDAQLAVVGGASVLDHAAYAARCRALIARLGLGFGPGEAVVGTGPVPQEAMPALYRRAAVLLFPSLSEGFGLAVIEAMACGTPVIASRIAPFTEYLSERDVLFVDPAASETIAAALHASLVPERRGPLLAAGHAVAERFSWQASARRHLDLYAALVKPREAALA